MGRSNGGRGAATALPREDERCGNLARWEADRLGPGTVARGCHLAVRRGRGVSRRLTGDGGYLSPVWSPDGTRLAAVTRDDDGSPVLAVIDVDRGGAPQRLRLEIGGQTATYWASTNTVFLQRIAAGTPGRLATLPMDGTSQPRPLFEWSSQMQYPAFSRDGKWMSYSVNETGAYEVYVRPVPSGTPVVRVSVNGGSSSAWSPDGRQLFYREGSRMMAVAISTDRDLSSHQTRTCPPFATTIPAHGTFLPRIWSDAPLRRRHRLAARKCRGRLRDPTGMRRAAHPQTRWESDSFLQT